jgi:predicted RNase H-like nuclease (RuvC/YqgF family)
MPRPDRSNQAGAQGSMQQPMAGPSMGGAPMQGGGIREDIRALNSSILLITQKIKYLVRNEKILGRNLVVLNKKIKSLDDKMVNSPQASSSGGSMNSEEVEALRQKVALLEAQIEDLRARSASTESLKELKYVIDSINPLEFATLSQVRDLIDKRLKEKGM